MKTRSKKLSHMLPPTGRFLQVEVFSIWESQGAHFYDDRIAVMFRTEHHAAIQHKFPLYSGDNINFARLVDCTLGRSEQEMDIRLQDLVGQRCGIKIESVLHDGQLSAEIVDICSLGELAEKQPVQLAK